MLQPEGHTILWFDPGLPQQTRVLSCWRQLGFNDAPLKKEICNDIFSAYFGCALDDSGKIHCWGDIPRTNDSTNRYVPFWTWNNHGCTINAEGVLQCWGSNDAEQGTPPYAQCLYVQVSAGQHNCSLRDDETIECWGLDDMTQSSHPHCRGDFDEVLISTDQV